VLKRQWTARHAQQVLTTMFHAPTCLDCYTQARETVQEAKESSQESEDDWEANAESWEDMDAVPAIGPAAAQAKQKVPLYTLFALHALPPASPPPPPPAPAPLCLFILHIQLTVVAQGR